MQDCIYNEKIRIIQEATAKQFLEIEELKTTGVLDPQEAGQYQDIIIEVLEMQKETICV